MQVKRGDWVEKIMKEGRTQQEVRPTAVDKKVELG
jgi:hypothetical protein